ncbi:MAG: VWA domain-containing protein [Dehalococcoidia bacterium]
MAEAPRLEDAVEFAENPEPRCPCVLLLDTSGSMQGAPIEALNRGLQTFKDDLMRDPVAPKRVEVAVVTFDNDVTVVQDFVTADRFEAPRLESKGMTHMAAGINTALDMIQARKDRYNQSGVPYYRPWVLMITDGRPQGEMPDFVDLAAQRIQEEEATKRVVFFGVGVEGADIPILSEIVVRTPLRLRGLNFNELFVWLSRSMHAVSDSKVGDQVALQPPGWAVVD